MSPRVVTFHYTLTDKNGQTIDSSVGQEPMTYMEGAQQIIPGLESRILPLKAKDKSKIQVPAEEGYGKRDERAVINVPRERLPKELEVGQQFQVTQDPNSPPFMVASISDTHAVLDGNHPLAGVDLTFDVEIVEIREATAEEAKHGHAHGAGGHHH